VAVFSLSDEQERQRHERDPGQADQARTDDLGDEAVRGEQQHQTRRQRQQADPDRGPVGPAATKRPIDGLSD
jgi:hypothetical protein